MGYHSIDVDPYNPASIERANRYIENYVNNMNRKISLYLEELAKIGRDAARGAYGGAVSVEVVPSGNGFSVVASGKAVAFLEFGAGATTDSGNRYAPGMPFTVARGSYSDENSGEYQATNYQYWHFGGVKYTEITPRGGMQKAYEEIRAATRTVAQRIFG